MFGLCPNFHVCFWRSGRRRTKVFCVSMWRFLCDGMRKKHIVLFVWLVWFLEPVIKRPNVRWAALIPATHFSVVLWILWRCWNLQRKQRNPSQVLCTGLSEFLFVFVLGRGRRRAGGRCWWTSTRRSRTSWGSSWRRLRLWPRPRSCRLVTASFSWISSGWNIKRARDHWLISYTRSHHKVC